MGNICWVYLVIALCFGLFVNTLSQEDSDSDSDTITSVYIVSLKQAPAAHYFEEELRRQSHHGFNHGSTLGRLNRLHKPRHEILPSVAQDGVDILSLSITPNRRPPDITTFFNPINMALLSAVKAGIFVVQAAGNTGPAPKSMSSFSPWIFTIGPVSHDRAYANSIILGNNVTIPGVGLAHKFTFHIYCLLYPYDGL